MATILVHFCYFFEAATLIAVQYKILEFFLALSEKNCWAKVSFIVFIVAECTQIRWQTTC